MTNREKDASAAGTCRAALLTPPGRGAVATILVQGQQATTLVDHCFQAAARKPLSKFPLNHIVFGRFVASDGPGEELVVCRTSEDQIEVHCHGGRAAAEAIFHALTSMGCQHSDWQEMVVDQESDPLSAEAREALAAARTERTAAILLDQYRGALRTALEAIIARLDEGQLDTATQQLRLLDRYSELGTHLTQPWKIVLTGRPNVGKSSLINAMLGYQRSIVFDQPGTTRDVLTAQTALDGWPVELFDTAGLRNSDDALEAEGAALALQQVQRADAVVLVFDASLSWSREDAALMAQFPQAVIVHNKSDLTKAEAKRPPGIVTSALDGQGIEVLLAVLIAQLVQELPPPQSAVPFTEQQVKAIRAALAEVQQDAGKNALSLLREIAPSSKE